MSQTAEQLDPIVVNEGKELDVPQFTKKQVEAIVQFAIDNNIIKLPTPQDPDAPTVYEIKQNIENVPQDMLNKLKVADVLIANEGINFCITHTSNYVEFMSFNFSDDKILSTSYAEYYRQSDEDNYELSIFVTEDTQLPISSGTKLYVHNLSFANGNSFRVITPIATPYSNLSFRYSYQIYGGHDDNNGGSFIGFNDDDAFISINGTTLHSTPSSNFVIIEDNVVEL